MRVIQCPPGTPHQEILEELWAVITFEPVFQEGPIDWRQKRDEALESVKEPAG